MAVLRTPKALVGAELGIPNLSVRAWFEARYGAEAWERITWLPRHDWMRYLRWYRGIADLDIRNDTSVVGIEPAGACTGVEDGRTGGRRYRACPPDCTGHWPRWRRGVDRARHRRACPAAAQLYSFEQGLSRSGG